MYKGKYLICICDNDIYQLIRWQFDTVYALSKFLQTTYKSAKGICHSVFTGKSNTVLIQGEKYILEFIEGKEEE